MLPFDRTLLFNRNRILGDIDVEAPHLDISLFNPMNYSLHWIPKFKVRYVI